MAQTLSLVNDKCVSISTIGEVGVSSIDSYSEDIDGVGVVNRTFAISKNGIHFSKEYNPDLPSDLLSAYSDSNITSRDTVWFRVTFVLASGTATINSFEFSLTKDESFVKNNSFNKTIFKNFFTIGYTEAQTPWARAVLEKLYKRIVPMYIERTKNIDLESDKDFIDLWRSVSTYFAMYVKYARVFGEFYSQRDLLFEFLSQRGIFLCGDETLSQLNFIARNYHNEHRRRGTIMPTTDWEDSSVTDPASGKVNGEILRVLCKNDCDEFVFNINRQEDIGFTVDNQSPLYKGLSHVRGFKLTKEKGVFNQISEYEVDQGTVTINSDNTATFSSGTTSLSTKTGSDAIAVNPCFTHEFCFEMKAPSSEVTMTIDLASFTDSGTQIDLLAVSDNSANNQPINYTFASGSFVEGEWYMFRVLLFGSKIESTTIPEEMSHFPLVGKNVKFAEEPCRITAKLTLSCSQEVDVKDFRVGLSTLYYGRGFIQSSTYVETLMKNNNTQKSYVEIQEIIKQYFIPYSSALSLVPGDCPNITSTYWNDVFLDPWTSISVDDPEWIWGDDFNINENAGLLIGVPL